nr:hypothetical protein [Tanacetum cinerariifolium]
MAGSGGGFDGRRADGNVLANDNVKKGVMEPSLKLTHTSLASLVSNEARNHRVNFRSLDTGKPTNEPVSSVLGFEVHLMFEYSLYVYFMGKRVVSLVENYRLCGVCIVFGHDKSTCLKQVVADVNKQSGKANDEFDSKHGSYVELMVNSSSNDNKVGKSSVQANEYSESHVEDIYKTGEFKASKYSKSESEIGNKSMYEG